MSDKIETSICMDCLYTEANGWNERETGRPLPDPAPLNRLDGYLIGWDSEVEPHFSWAPCDGCGSTLGGDRQDVTLVPVRHEVCWIDDTTCPECSAEGVV